MPVAESPGAVRIGHPERGSGAIPFDVKFVPAGTGSAVWDDPYVDQLIHRFMPHDRKHGPMLGILHMGAARPTPGVLRNLVVTVGEDVKAGRYGNFSLFIYRALLHRSG